MKHLRTYNLAVQFYRDIKTVQLPVHLKDQMLRAASSIALNLAEATGRTSAKDQRRFFSIAFGSIREVQAVMNLENEAFSTAQHQAIDQIAASAFKLIKHCCA